MPDGGPLHGTFYRSCTITRANIHPPQAQFVSDFFCIVIFVAFDGMECPPQKTTVLEGIGDRKVPAFRRIWNIVSVVPFDFLRLNLGLLLISLLT